MKGFLLAIDQGTTGSTALVVSPDAQLLGKANEEFPQHYPKPGWVEHDLDEIWASVKRAIAHVIETTGVSPSDCLGIGITNQRETTVVWERSTGHPIHPAIVWQDRRTADVCAGLRAAGHEPFVKQKTGLLFDPYFSGTKLAWILDNVPDARARAERGELAFGTIDSWLISKLSGGDAHVTDVSNASRTLLLDIHAATWSKELCDIIRVPMSVLPEVRSSSEVYAKTRGVPGLPDGIPIAGVAGDQQAALFGQTCFTTGDVKCTYGTGAFILMNTGDKPMVSSHGLLTTIAWKVGDKTMYALEGSAFIAGAAVQWLRDGLGIIRTASDVERLAKTVESTGDVIFVPALAGLGAPHWDPNARGLLWGMTRDTTAAHICRATLEGIAYQVADLALAMAKDAGSPLRRVRVDGGAAANDLMMQFQSDLLDASVDRPASLETTGLGAAYLAGLAVGVFTDLDAVVRKHRIERTFNPKMGADERARRLGRWHAAVARARSELGNS
jgi:glycerol kinase